MYVEKPIIKNGRIINAWTIAEGEFRWLTIAETMKYKKENPLPLHDGSDGYERQGS